MGLTCQIYNLHKVSVVLVLVLAHSINVLTLKLKNECGAVLWHSDSTILASATVVYGILGTVSGRATTVATGTVVDIAIRDGCLPLESRDSKTTCMVIPYKCCNIYG